ncbi:hypothetical cytosolic protein [Syntrophus aciditrophicus SB]|uniref:Hypothetical cytosolic protein n=1 Tax=Syntrophus aciditrophicus (strain SB) TaxID=56780 RepID=Q2LSG6_SYNAS|nr:hypothetical cytosolic protein [Syntrophus aciditrophicus SB]
MHLDSFQDIVSRVAATFKKSEAADLFRRETGYEENLVEHHSDSAVLYAGVGRIVRMEGRKE